MPVKVILIHRRQDFEARWIDEVTGKKKTRTTGTHIRRDAERFAARLEDELNSGTTMEPVRVLWKTVVDRYTDEVLPTLAKKTGNKAKGTFNKVKALIDPKFVTALNASQISKFAAAMLAENLAPHTIKSHLAILQKVLGWACRMGLLKAVPNIQMPRVVPTMKGRPITDEEFDRLLAAVFKVICDDPDSTEDAGESGEAIKRYPDDIATAETWCHLLRGLRLSGLRLEEAMKLHWRDTSQISIDLSGERPMMTIQAADQKNRKHAMHPLTPDFAEFLEQTPERDRRGYVFNPRPLRAPVHYRPSVDWVSKVISRIGEEAKIKVSPTKFASAHDLRRTFGYKWSRIVKPFALQALMRHASIVTTQQFYLGQNAEDASKDIFDDFAAFKTKVSGNTIGNKPQPDVSPEAVPASIASNV